MANTLPPTDVNIDGSTSGGASGLDAGTLIPQILGKFVLVLEAAAVIAVGFLLIRYVRRYLRKIEIAHEQQRNVINLLEKITSGFIVVISITLALKVVGLDMTLLVSVAILGLSYGLQDIIKNYVAGILILFKAPFKIGETVKIREYTGKVYKMDFQSTTLETFDHRYITIYNSDVMTQSIVNFSAHTVGQSPMRRLSLDVMLGYGSNTTKALQVFDRILKNQPAVLKNPLYSITFKKFSESAIEFTLKFWIQMPANVLQVRSEIALQISQAFDEEKLFMPYSKDIQFEADYTLGDDRKKQLKDFYGQPIFTDNLVAGGGPNGAQAVTSGAAVSAGPGVGAGATVAGSGSIAGAETGAVTDIGTIDPQIASNGGMGGDTMQVAQTQVAPGITMQLQPVFIDAEEPE